MNRGRGVKRISGVEEMRQGYIMHKEDSQGYERKVGERWGKTVSGWRYDEDGLWNRVLSGTDCEEGLVHNMPL